MARMIARLRARRSEERGAVLVEFAFVGPLLFLMIIGLLDFSLIIVGNTVGTNASREGARTGVISYVNADVEGSANHTLIVDSIKKRLAGMVRGDIAVKVRCVDGDDYDLDDATIPCTRASVVPGRDLLEVSFEWSHLAASPFVSNAVNRESAMFVIQGTGTYSAPGATTTTLIGTTSSTASTTTSSTSTTTTLADGSTTTTAPGDTTTTSTTSTTTTAPPGPCRIVSYNLSKTPTMRIYTSGVRAGDVRPNQAIRVTVFTAGCNEGEVNFRIPLGPAPYAAGVAMDYVGANEFSYTVGGSNWRTGTFAATIRTLTNSESFNVTVTN